ncbi:MAG: hypothetical protein J6R32_11295 [Bacteroidales bacterium]|nr:hypothetical protein [Bacteroidales bacterium]
MNITELVSVVSSGCKVDEVKEISALGVSVADAIKLSKAGLSVDDIKNIVSSEDKKDDKSDNEDDKKDASDNKDDKKDVDKETPQDEKDKEILELKKELEKAQKANINKDVKKQGEDNDPLKIAMEAISNF